MNFAKHALLVGACLLATASLGSSKKLPDYVQVCKRSEKNFDQCTINAIEKVRPYLAKGIPKIKVPALEPLYIPQLQINRDLENLKVKANLKEIKVYGGSGFIINKLKTSLEKHAIELSITIPRAEVSTEYDVDGRLLVVPLRGTGVFKGNFTDIKADVKAAADLTTSPKGTKYLKIKSITAKVRVGDQTVRFINTDQNSNNALITQTAATFVNQNKRQVLDIVTPIAEETAIAFIEQIGNNILRAIPYNELLPQ
jgi:hypothetical protein